MNTHKHPPQPVHQNGIKKGEEAVYHQGREAGRGGRQYRSARDSTGINSANREPIHPDMPNIPPA
jgi:hypothetical protein